MDTFSVRKLTPEESAEYRREGWIKLCRIITDDEMVANLRPGVNCELQPGEVHACRQKVASRAGYCEEHPTVLLRGKDATGNTTYGVTPE